MIEKVRACSNKHKLSPYAARMSHLKECKSMPVFFVKTVTFMAFWKLSLATGKRMTNEEKRENGWRRKRERVNFQSRVLRAPIFRHLQ